MPPKKSKGKGKERKEEAKVESIPTIAPEDEAGQEPEPLPGKLREPEEIVVHTPSVSQVFEILEHKRDGAEGWGGEAGSSSGGGWGHDQGGWGEGPGGADAESSTPGDSSYDDGWVQGQGQNWEQPATRPPTPPRGAAAPPFQVPPATAPSATPSVGSAHQPQPRTSPGQHLGTSQVPQAPPGVLTSASQVAQRAAAGRSSQDTNVSNQRPAYYWGGPGDQNIKSKEGMTPPHKSTPAASVYASWGQPKRVDPWGDPKPAPKPKAFAPAKTPAPPKPSGGKQAWEYWGKEGQQASRVQSVQSSGSAWGNYHTQGDEYSEDESEETFTEEDAWGPPAKQQSTWHQWGHNPQPQSKNPYGHYTDPRQKSNPQHRHSQERPSHHPQQQQQQQKPKKDQSRHHQEAKGKKKQKNQGGDWGNGDGWGNNGEWDEGGGWGDGGDGGESDHGWDDGQQEGWGQGNNDGWGQPSNGHEKGRGQKGGGHDTGWGSSNSHDKGGGRSGGKGWGQSNDGHDQDWGDGQGGAADTSWGTANQGGGGGGGGWGDSGQDHSWGEKPGNHGAASKSQKRSTWGGSQAETTYSMPSRTMTHAYNGTHLPPSNAPKTDKMNEYANINFIESKGMAFAKVHKAMFGRERKAKDRIHWMFSPDKDERVSALMEWITALEYDLGSYGLHNFLQSRERGALFVNANFRMEGHPYKPAFDWLTYDQLRETRDPIFQNSVINYDPAMIVYIFVFLPSESGNSTAVWRRKVLVPNDTRLRFGQEIAIAKSGLRRDKDYVVHVDECVLFFHLEQELILSRLPPASKEKAKEKEKSRSRPKEPKLAKDMKMKLSKDAAHKRGYPLHKSLPVTDEKKKRKWWQVLRFAE